MQTKVKKGKESQDHEMKLCNIETFFEARKIAINLFNYYAEIIFEVDFNVTKGK